MSTTKSVTAVKKPRTISARLSDVEFKQVKLFALNHSKTVDAVIRDALKAYMVKGAK